MKKSICNKLPSNESFICLFSGGKDCMLALSMAMQHGKAVSLLTTIKDINESNNHNQKIEFIKEQAASIGLPLDVCIGDPQTPHLFYNIVKRLKKYDRSIKYLVTGILNNINDYNLNCEIAELAGMTLCCPLWKMDYENIIKEMEERKIQAIITSIRHSNVSINWMGKLYDRNAYNCFKDLKIDPLGELGEFHTTVIDCDLYKDKLSINY